MKSRTMRRKIQTFNPAEKMLWTMVGANVETPALHLSAANPATKAGIQVLQALPVKAMEQVGRAHLDKGQVDMVLLVDKVQVEVKDLAGKAAVVRVPVVTEDIDDD